MNFNMIQPKNETEDLLLSITKNCEKLIEQTHRKAEDTLEFKMNKPREIFHFNAPNPIEGSWMVDLLNLEVYNSFLNINQTNDKFELNKDTFDEFSFEELKGELEGIVNILNISNEHLQDEIGGPRIISEYKKLQTEK